MDTASLPNAGDFIVPNSATTHLNSPVGRMGRLVLLIQTRGVGDWVHCQFSNSKTSYNSGVRITIESLTQTQVRVGGNCDHNADITTPAHPTKSWTIMKTATKLKVWRDSQLVLKYEFPDKCIENWIKEVKWFWFKTVRAPKSGNNIFYKINKIITTHPQPGMGT